MRTENVEIDMDVFREMLNNAGVSVPNDAIVVQAQALLPHAVRFTVVTNEPFDPSKLRAAGTSG